MLYLSPPSFPSQPLEDIQGDSGPLGQTLRNDGVSNINVRNTRSVLSRNILFLILYLYLAIYYTILYYISYYTYCYLYFIFS